MREYLKHELADDSDDEKIYKAESRTGRSMKKPTSRRQEPHAQGHIDPGASHIPIIINSLSVLPTQFELSRCFKNGMF